MYIYIERYVAEEPEITQTDLCLYTHIHKIDGGRSVTPLQRGSPEPRCTAQRPHSPPPCPPHPPLTAAPRGRTGKMAAASPQAGRAAGRGRPPAAAGGHGGAPGAGTPGGRGGESGSGPRERRAAAEGAAPPVELFPTAGPRRARRPWGGGGMQRWVLRLHGEHAPAPPGLTVTARREKSASAFVTATRSTDLPTAGGFPRGCKKQ